MALGDIGKIPYTLIPSVAGQGEPQLDAAVHGGTAYTTNPAIGLPEEELGFFAYHYAASNIAVAFAKPEIALVDAVFPPSYSIDSIRRVLSDLRREARRYGTRIIGGHTARYKGVQLPLLAVTAAGPTVRERRRPEPGDKVLLVGRPALESLHLLGRDVDLELLTPLPDALALHRSPSVKLMHDVSEGGIAGALLEIAHAYGVGVELNPLPRPPGLPAGIDVLSAPSYGVLIVIAGDESPCSDAASPCMAAGRIVEGPPRLHAAGRILTSPPPNPLWRLYGEKRLSDETLTRLKAAALELVALDGIDTLIPEVGMNIAYAPPGASKPSDVAAIDGRIVRTTRGPRLCGEPGYGASRHLALVLLASARRGLPWRAAVNLKPSPRLLSALREAGIEPVEVEARGACPVAEAIGSGVASRAVWYGPAPGLEPSLVLLGEEPEELVEVLRETLAKK